MEIRIVLLATLATSVAVIEAAVTRHVSNNYRYPTSVSTTVPRGYPGQPNQMMYPVVPNTQPGQDRTRRPVSQPKAGPRPGSGQPPQPQPNPNTRQRTQAMVTPGPKLDTTTQDRSIINAPSRTCPEGQRMDADRRCTMVYNDPDNEG